MADLHYGLEFTHPGWLAAVIAVPWVVWYFRRSLVDFARWQRAVSTGVRVAIVLLLVLSLAGFTLLRPTGRQFVIVAVDQSLSVGEEPLSGLWRQMLRKKKNRWRIGSWMSCWQRR